VIFHDFPGPGRKKTRTFQEAWEPCTSVFRDNLAVCAAVNRKISWLIAHHRYNICIREDTKSATPCNVALESWQWIHQVAAPCNVIRGSGMTCHWICLAAEPCSVTRSCWIITLNSPGGSTVQCGSGMTCQWIRPNVRHPTQQEPMDHFQAAVGCHYRPAGGSERRTAYRRGRSTATGPVTPARQTSNGPAPCLRNWASTNFLYYSTVTVLRSFIPLMPTLKLHSNGRTITQQYGGWYSGRWWVGGYIWYSEEGRPVASSLYGRS